MHARRKRTLHGLSVAVIGRGAAGGAFATALARAGARVRTLPGRGARIPAAGVDLFLLCVPDAALRAVAGRLERGATALHTSGFHGAGLLGALHPLVALPRGARGEALEGAWFAVRARGKALALARRIVRALGGRVLALPARAGPRHHLACTLVSNGAVALVDAALALHPARSKAAPALAALLEATARNLRRGPRAALTGPVARGDLDVVAGHLRLLERDPEAARLYRALARRLIALSGHAPGSATARRLERLARA